MPTLPQKSPLTVARLLCGILMPTLMVLALGLTSQDRALAQGTKLSQSESVKEEDRDQPEEREQWFYRGRQFPGESAAALRQRAHGQKLQLRAARLEALKTENAMPASSGTNGAWTPLGPAPLASDSSGFGLQDYGAVSGRATAVAIDPNDSSGNTVYIGGAYGGVWKSVNAGSASQSAASVTWAPLIDDRETLAVGAIAVQPGQSDPAKRVILVGTGETNSSGDSYYGLGIFRSADSGATWTLIPADVSGSHPFAGLGFSKIAFSTANPSLVVAASANTTGYYDNRESPVFVNRGIYYSTDAGFTWNFATILDGSTPIPVTSVVYNAAAGKFFAAIRYHGIYSSIDGATWSRLTNQPGNSLTLAACPTSWISTCPIYRGEFAVVPGRNEMYSWYVYVDASGSSRQIRDQGIWQTIDGGNSWQQINDSLITNCGDSAGCGVYQGLYDLELLATPNGSATDLYAGAINLYKCTITSLSPSCNGVGSNSFLNLTHVYGCPPFYGSIAHVHPDQHALDAMVVNGKAAMYFANDGGIYRALDGYTGLTSGDCSVPNQFDDLNQTLGSMTQFVAFSQSPSDASTILGGTQDNGSPATASAQSSSSWINVNAGDGGYNAINPDNPNQWFTANTGVSIQRCDAGVACHNQAGVNNPFIDIVDSSTVGNDAGPFYTPYILDPQNSAELIVGTCRVWRGTTSGASFAALSSNFDPGGGLTCASYQINKVRSLAVGGPTDANGFSNVIYAGTDGYGPNANTNPSGGHIWVTTNAAGGASSWIDQTGAINPNHFPVSAVAVDSADPTGQTAYVAIMGFHTSHVWQTTDAGASWTDFTANLPDSPANALAISSGSTAGNGIIYVGTDTGVFSSSTGSANWSEVGPAPRPAPGPPSGYLPNVSVTDLKIFRNGGNTLLRASTYGRGIWQFPLAVSPDFSLLIVPGSATANTGALATFSGTLTSLHGYGSAVNLSGCAASGAPPTCSITPATVIPETSGAGFTVMVASNAIQSYNFQIVGTGTDSAALTHSQSLTFNTVFDFSFPASPPLAQTVAAGQNASYMLTANPLNGNFPAAVSFSCTGLPSGSGCSFSPNTIPEGTGSTAIVLNVNTATTTSAGTFTIHPTATVAGGPSHTQTLMLTVTGGGSSPDFSLAITPATQTSIVGSPATFTGMLTSLNGYSSVVNLNGCAGSGAPPTCTISPATLTPTSSGTPFTITVSSNLSRSYSLNITGVGTDAATTTHSQPIIFNAFDFTLTALTTSQTVSAGSQATYPLDLKPAAGPFPASVSFACSVSPSLNLGACPSPGNVDAGSGESTVNLVVITIAPIAAVNSKGPVLAIFFVMALPLGGLFLAGHRGKKSVRNCLFLTSIAAILWTIGPLSGCGSGLSGNKGGQPGTNPGNYTITVTASMAGLPEKTLTLNLTVK